jgi:DNA-binding MarR family transcriptional regulator
MMQEPRGAGKTSQPGGSERHRKGGGMTDGQRRGRRNESRDFSGRLMTQSGPRTTAPMWARPFFTPGEWAVYTALWSYPNESVFPSHQDLADRSWVQWGTAKDAVSKMDRLGLLDRAPSTRDDGSDSTNTYFLVEVPTAEHLKAVESLKAERAEKQEDDRKKRKAQKRKYEKTQVTVVPAESAEGGCGGGSTPVRATGGAVEGAPRGCGVHRTPGGAVQGAPGCDVHRTLESLGVTPSVSVPSRSSSSPSGDDFGQNVQAESDPKTAEQELGSPPKIGNQEDYATDGYPLELTGWEAELAAELDRLRPDWGPRPIRLAVGHPSVRDRSASSPDLVRRAFLLAAADRPRGNHRGTWSPSRMTTDGCPFWSRALAEMETGAGAERGGTQPGPDLPGQRAGNGPAGPSTTPAFAPATRPPSEVAAMLAAGGWRSRSGGVLADAEAAN